MIRSTYLLVVLVIISFISSSKQQFVLPYSANAQFYNNYPNPLISNRLPLQRQVLPGGTIHYSLGFRVAGDRSVGQTYNSLQYPNPQDVQQKVWYPSKGQGGIVSYVEIWVDQTSPIGNAYVTQGGIGQRYITVVIEAKQTRVFSYRATIYAY